MPEPFPPHATDPVHPDVRSEKSDVNVRAVFWFGVGLVVVAVLAHLVLAWMFRDLRVDEDQKNPKLPPVASTRPQFPQDIKAIPEPRLQDNDVRDMEQLRAANEAQLNSYGWVDHSQKIVHLPIEQAIRMLSDPKIAAAHGVRTQASSETHKEKGR